MKISPSARSIPFLALACGLWLDCSAESPSSGSPIGQGGSGGAVGTGNDSGSSSGGSAPEAGPAGNGSSSGTGFVDASTGGGSGSSGGDDASGGNLGDAAGDGSGGTSGGGDAGAAGGGEAGAMPSGDGGSSNCGDPITGKPGVSAMDYCAQYDAVCKFMSDGGGTGHYADMNDCLITYVGMSKLHKVFVDYTRACVAYTICRIQAGCLKSTICALPDQYRCPTSSGTHRDETPPPGAMCK